MDLAPLHAALTAMNDEALPKGTALPVCPELLYWEVRHVARDCDIECPTHEWDTDAEAECPGTFGRFDGSHVAALINAVPALLAELEAARVELEHHSRCP